MSTGFSLDMSKLEQFMDGMQTRLENPSPLMHAIGELLVSSTKARLYAGKDLEGNPQPGVARGGIPLVDSADYVKSFTYNAGISDVTLGTNKEQAPLMHFGGEVKPKNAKALVFTPKGSDHPVTVKKVTVKERKHIGISEDDKVEIGDTVGLFLGGNLS